VQQPLNILVVIKHAPLFNIIKHVLADMPEAGKIGHLKSWPRLKSALSTGKYQVPFDIVILDIAQAEEAQAILSLRNNWPHAKLVLLAFDPELVAHRAGSFDAVLSKCALPRNLCPCLKRFARALPKHNLQAVPVTETALTVTARKANKVSEHKQVALQNYLPPINDPLPFSQDSEIEKCALNLT
jgi:hypothetical protein